MRPDGIRIFPDCLTVFLSDAVVRALLQTECKMSSSHIDGFVDISGSMMELYDFLVRLTCDCDLNLMNERKVIIMKMRVLGTQLQDYVSRKTGNPVKGVSLYCAFKDAQVDGEMVDSVWVSDNLDCARTAAAIKPGQLIDVEYNRRGSVADVKVIDDSDRAGSLKSQEAKK